MTKSKKLWKLLESNVIESQPSAEDVIEFMYQNNNIPIYDLTEKISANFPKSSMVSAYASLPESTGELSPEEGGAMTEVSPEVAAIKNILKDALLVAYDHYDQVDEVYGNESGLNVACIPDFIVLDKIARNSPIY